VGVPMSCRPVMRRPLEHQAPLPCLQSPELWCLCPAVVELATTANNATAKATANTTTTTLPDLAEHGDTEIEKCSANPVVCPLQLAPDPSPTPAWRPLLQRRCAARVGRRPGPAVRGLSASSEISSGKEPARSARPKNCCHRSSGLILVVLMHGN
jgi:hypothetical protein